MQVQTTILGTKSSREITYFCVPLLAVLWELRHSIGARLILGQWFENPAVDGASRRLATAAGSQHSLAGVNTRNLSQQLGTSRTIIEECSPPMKYTSSNPFSSAHVMPPPRPTRTTTRLRLAMWFNSALVPAHTGKRLSCWFAGCALMARSAARFCGRIVAAMLWRGTPTARRQSSKSEPHPSMNPRCVSARGVMTGPPRVYINPSGNRLDARRVQPSGKQPSRQLVGFILFVIGTGLRPDNEYYVAPCRSP